MLSDIREYDIYKDIEKRCNGEIYIGLAGPVRTGKSTFIKRFMEKMVIPNMKDPYARDRAVDELPQSANGKTITTTEPKFIPAQAAAIAIGEDIQANVRLIDCVGYMVDGAIGHMENDQERLVKTPWFDYELPFSKAAEIGTDKCINDHSTIGIIITTDGSFGELLPENYINAEEKTINTFKNSGKPFIVIVNSGNPTSKAAMDKKKDIEEKYHVCSMIVDCLNLNEGDIRDIFENLLYEFPISSIEFNMPGWMKALDNDSNIKQELIQSVLSILDTYSYVRDILVNPINITNQYIKNSKIDKLYLENGNVIVSLNADEGAYYQYMSEIYGEKIEDEQELVKALKEYSVMKNEYTKVLKAIDMVRSKGYGVVLPDTDEISLEQPEVIKHGNRYGVKIKAVSPSIHMIKADIETEIAPIVGSKEQADDLIEYITKAGENQKIWDTNIFGKTVEQMVKEGISAKILAIGEESQIKLQDTMQKIVNDMNGGLICIII